MPESPSRPQIFSPTAGPNKLVARYLAEHSPAFVRLQAVRKEGWENPEGDAYWQNRRERSDTAREDTARAFYDMTKQIAKEMQEETGALTSVGLDVQAFQVLDLCMAPGGFTWGAMKYNPGAIAFGITLPPEMGGYKNWFPLPAGNIEFVDIAMLASEFGVEQIPAEHPDYSLFLDERPFIDERFQLIFCGGAVLRSHERSVHRQEFERTRLTTSQLILAMQRIISGGTMVVLLRRPDALEVLRLLYQFDSFSNIQLFKPRKKHAARSTFYLVAKNVQPHVDSAKAALEDWKMSWLRATFGSPKGTGEKELVMDVQALEKVLDEFGPKLIRLATPTWKIQAGALERQDYNKARSNRRRN